MTAGSLYLEVCGKLVKLYTQLVLVLVFAPSFWLTFVGKIIMNNYNGNSVPKETSSEEDVEDVTSNEEQTKNAKPSLNSQQPNWFMRIYAL